jgi:hypothetical protein
MIAPRRILLASLSLLLFTASLCHAQQKLDNAAVVKLHAAGLSDDLIVQTVASSPGHYDTGIDAMIALKKAGIGDRVISAMVSKNANPNGPAPAAAAVPGGPATPAGIPAGVTDVGVYSLNASGGYDDVPSEVVNYKTGGVLKGMASGGLIKGDLNGNINGPSSKLKMNSPATFIIYVMEGQSPNDYQLLRLRANSNSREFRSKTGGIVHQSSGASRDMVDFDAKKIAPRIYQVVLPVSIGKGEYGFLPPMTMNSGSNLASSGKIFSFTITE